MSPGWQISRTAPPDNDPKDTESATERTEAASGAPPETGVEAAISETVLLTPEAVAARSHSFDRSATPLDTERRLSRTTLEENRKSRAKLARTASAARKAAAQKSEVVVVEVPAAARKTGTRRRGREMAMQLLFQADVGKQPAEEVRASFWGAAEKVDRDTRGFADDLFRVATTRDTEIDQLIEAHSANWRLPRMAAVDRNLLRAATAELLGFPGTPVPIVINESLEIARRYSAPESINFLNGVLDAISRSRQ